MVWLLIVCILLCRLCSVCSCLMVGGMKFVFFRIWLVICIFLGMSRLLFSVCGVLVFGKLLNLFCVVVVVICCLIRVLSNFIS